MNKYVLPLLVFLKAGCYFVPMKLYVIANKNSLFSMVNQREARARVCRPHTGSSPPVVKLQAVQRRLFCLFWFFGDFRCCVLLFMITFDIYKYKNR